MLAFLADNALSHLLIGPLTALFWRGAWEFLNRHLFPDNPELGAWICFAIGNGGLVGLALSQNLWTTYIGVEKTCSIKWLVGYHLYTYILGVLNVFHWRGLWELLDIYTGVNGISCLASFVIGQCTLWLFRCSKTLISPPLVVDIDNDPAFFLHSGRFHAKFVMSMTNIIDSIFTVVFIHQMTVFYWRGLWEVFDVYVFPENGYASSVICLLVSFLLHGLLCILQPIFNRLFRSAEKSDNRKTWQWLLETFIYFLGNPVCVTQWRGVWNLCNEYVDPSNADVVDLTLHFLSVGVLMMMACGHTVTTRGCFLEGDNSVDDGCMFPNKYFRHWMEKQMQKQEQAVLLPQQDQQLAQDQQVVVIENKTTVLLSNGDNNNDKYPVSVMMITVL